MIYPPASASLTNLMLARRKRRHRQRRRYSQLSHTNESGQRQSNKKTRISNHKVKYVNGNGERITLSPTKTFWWMYYLNFPDRGNRQFENKFRNRFRLPYDSFQELYDLV